MAKCRFPTLGRLYEKSRVSAHFRVTLLVSEVTPAGFCEGLGLLFVYGGFGGWCLIMGKRLAILWMLFGLLAQQHPGGRDRYFRIIGT